MAESTVTVVGNVTRDPEIRYTSGGAAKATFGVAVPQLGNSTGTFAEV